MSQARVVELAGLPGVGKSTVTGTLLARLGPTGAAWSGSWRSRLRSLRIGWLFLPCAALCYHRPLAYLLAEDSGSEPPNGQLAVASRMWNVIRRGRRNRQGASFARLRFLLAASAGLAEYSVTRLEAGLRRRPIVVDEGLVQLGTALWLGTPPGHRERFWQHWVAALPGRPACLLLDLEPDLALARASGRSTGLPWIFATAETLHGTAVSAGSLYAEIHDLLVGETLRQGVQCQSMHGATSAEALAGDVTQALDAIAPGYLVAARPPNAADGPGDVPSEVE